MAAIEVLVITIDGKEHKLTLKSYNSSVLLLQLPLKMRNLIKRVESNGEKVLSTEVTFKGDWNMLLLDRFTSGLEKRNVKWKWEL